MTASNPVTPTRNIVELPFRLWWHKRRLTLLGGPTLVVAVDRTSPCYYADHYILAATPEPTLIPGRIGCNSPTGFGRPQETPGDIMFRLGYERAKESWHSHCAETESLKQQTATPLELMEATDPERELTLLSLLGAREQLMRIAQNTCCDALRESIMASANLGRLVQQRTEDMG